MNQAYFHECLNFASVRTLPVVFVCENNLYGEWTAMYKVTGGRTSSPARMGTEWRARSLTGTM